MSVGNIDLADYASRADVAQRAQALGRPYPLTAQGDYDEAQDDETADLVYERGPYARTTPESKTDLRVMRAEQETAPLLAEIAAASKGTRILAINGNAGDKPFWDAVAADNANTAEVDTFTDGPEERYQAVPTGITGSQLVRVFDRQRPKRALCWGTVEDMDLIVDALNAYEASQ